MNVATTLVTFLFLRAAPATDVALLPLVLFIGSAVSVAITLGSGTVILRTLPRLSVDRGDEEALAALALARYQLVLGLGGVVVAAPLVAYLLTLGVLEGESVVFALEVYAAGVLLGVGQASAILLQGAREYGTLAVAQAVSALTIQLGSLGLFLAVGRVGILIAAALSAVPMVLASTRWLVANGLFRAHGSRSDLNVSRAELNHLRLHALVRFALVNSDYLVLASLFSRAEIAAYWVAYKLVNYLFMAAQSVTRPLVTELAAHKGDTGEQRSLARGSARASIVVLGGAACAMAAIAPWFTRWYGGPTYAGVYPVMIVLAGYGMLYVVYQLHQSVTFSVASGRELLRLETFAGVAGLGLTALFGALGGLVGVAAGQCAGMAVGIVLALRPSRPVLRIRDYGDSFGVWAVASALSLWPFVFPAVSTGLILAPVVLAVSGVVYLFVANRVSSAELRAEWTGLLPEWMRGGLSLLGGVRHA